MLNKGIYQEQTFNGNSLVLSARHIVFVEQGYLKGKAELNSETNIKNSMSSSIKIITREIINNAPLSTSKYYYYPPSLIPSSEDIENFKLKYSLNQQNSVGKGLLNSGWNTCYLNSILQALTYAPPILYDCLNMRHHKVCKYYRENLVCLLCMFEDHILTVFDGNEKSQNINKSQRAIAPNILKCAQKLIWRKFRIGIMQDAHEFLRYFLEGLHKASVPKNLQSDDIFRKLNPIDISTTYIGQLFCGFFRSQIVCFSCLYMSNTYDPFMDIPLDIVGVSSLENAFSIFTKKEYLQGANQYKCPKCEKKSDASKEVLIEKLPPLLTIQLKRFSFIGHGSKKPYKSIKYNEVLDMSSYMTTRNTCNSQVYAPNNSLSACRQSFIYDLWSVVCHSGGSLSGGHYYTYAKGLNNQWYCFNDETVRISKSSEVLNETIGAYLLFYAQRNQLQFNETFILAPDIPLCLKSGLHFGDIEFESSKTNTEADFTSNDEPISRLTNILPITRPPQTNNEGIVLSIRNFKESSEKVGSNKIFSDINTLKAVKKSIKSNKVSLNETSEKRNSKDISCMGLSKSLLQFLLKLSANFKTSRTRRGLSKLIHHREVSTFLRLLGYKKTYRASYLDGNEQLDSELEQSDINKVNLSGTVQRWDDINLTDEQEQMIKDAEDSILPAVSRRSEYDREYDKGKIKKPLRKLQMSFCTGELYRNTSNTLQYKKESLFGRQQFDLAAIQRSEGLGKKTLFKNKREKWIFTRKHSHIQK
ncbi:ubiquitin carboxyl-terminal hydrolase domain-containing protein [Cryptosporidium andersoni]|uniref:ubiquitinyl hydrolase 1 n=1 Tax=Cryptosporidium andersoni TaxID=117008 RepID=A0A1J4MUV8_9CRYT|nr:ubiquitin carboxyl-terminal hydrolase domain-containing protein [Cryptosporidium andersoni]